MATYVKQIVLSNGLVQSGTAGNPDRNADCTSILTVANGGTGTATPSLSAGISTVVTGTWPGQSVSLVNDVATPGNNYCYGTDGSGTKGWVALPVSSTSGVWNYSTTLTMADPGSGKLRVNNSLWLSVTALAINYLDQNNFDRTPILSSLVTGDIIMVQDKGNAGNWVKYTVSGTPTNNTSWFQIPVLIAGGAGTAPANNAPLLVQFQQVASGGGGGGGPLTVGTTSIAAGTSGYLLYDNATVLGESNVIDGGNWI